MKKVRSPKQIKTRLANTPVRPKRSMTNKLDRAKNLMINEEALKGKTGGSSLEDYNLDLMRLT